MVICTETAGQPTNTTIQRADRCSRKDHILDKKCGMLKSGGNDRCYDVGMMELNNLGEKAKKCETKQQKRLEP